MESERQPEWGAGQAARLHALLLNRMDGWWDTSLTDASRPGALLAEPEVPLLEHLWTHRAALTCWIETRPWAEAGGETWSRRPDRALGRRLVRWLHHRNQFLELDRRSALHLDAGYRRWLIATARLLRSARTQAALADGIHAVLSSHHEGVTAIVRARLGENLPDVVCAEYSPALQLRVLGLTLADIREPVLDVGCGSGAELVRWLRAHGRSAIGLDRHAPAGVAIRADWRRFPFGDSRWGTVVSHLGLSLHLLRHHATGDAGAVAQVAAYRRVLVSLRPGGVFAYAPGLPFLETLLSADEFRVEYEPLPGLLSVFGHATRVWRRAD